MYYIEWTHRDKEFSHSTYNAQLDCYDDHYKTVEGESYLSEQGYRTYNEAKKAAKQRLREYNCSLFNTDELEYSIVSDDEEATGESVCDDDDTSSSKIAVLAVILLAIVAYFVFDFDLLEIGIVIVIVCLAWEYITDVIIPRFIGLVKLMMILGIMTTVFNAVSWFFGLFF